MDYITSKKDSLGMPTWQSPWNYFELGWEVSTTHLDAKALIASGQFNASRDRIVTLAGREFLYTKLARTCTWEMWAEQHGVRDSEVLRDCVDLTYEYTKTAQPTAVYYAGSEKRYHYENQIRNLIVSLDTPDVAALGREPFALCCWRYRGNHIPTRNTSEKTALPVQKFLLERFYRAYVVGNGAEPLCDGKSVVHVDLPTYAGLCMNPNCQLVTGAMTGTMQLAAIITKARLAVYQHNAQEPCNTSNHPAVMGECVNLMRNTRRVWYQPVTPLAQFLKELELFIEPCIKKPSTKPCAIAPKIRSSGSSATTRVAATVVAGR